MPNEPSPELKRRFHPHATDPDVVKDVLASGLALAVQLEELLPRGREAAAAVASVELGCMHAREAVMRPASSAGRPLDMRKG